MTKEILLSTFHPWIKNAAPEPSPLTVGELYVYLVSIHLAKPLQLFNMCSQVLLCTCCANCFPTVQLCFIVWYALIKNGGEMQHVGAALFTCVCFLWMHSLQAPWHLSSLPFFFLLWKTSFQAMQSFPLPFFWHEMDIRCQLKNEWIRSNTTSPWWQVCTGFLWGSWACVFCIYLHILYRAMSQRVVIALTAGRELFITIRITYCALKSPACALYHGVRRRHILMHNRQYENAAGSWAQASGLGS